jgi:hypothetical protein
VTDRPTKVYSGQWRLEHHAAERSGRGAPVWAVFTPVAEPAFLWVEHVGEIRTLSELESWLLDAGVERVHAHLLTEHMAGWFDASWSGEA